MAEIAELLRLNPQTVRNWIDQGSLPAVRVGRRVRVRQSDLDHLINQGVSHGAEEQAPQAPLEEERLSRRALANRLQRSVSWVDIRVRDGMPYEPATGNSPHRHFRLADVQAWLEQRAATQPTRDSDDAESADVEHLAGALADATGAVEDGDQSQLADALRALASVAERLADGLERRANCDGES